MHRLLAPLSTVQHDSVILWTSAIPLAIIAECLSCPIATVRAALQVSMQVLRHGQERTV